MADVMLVRARISLAAISALALLAVGAGARAETAGGQAGVPAADGLNIRTIDPNHWNSQPASSHKSLLWSQKNRWSLKLDMNQPVGREMQLRDIQAGAYYRVTPSLRVGGSVAFSEEPNQPNSAPLPTTQAPQVKLETTFKF